MITVVINGQNYNYPEVGDTDWGSIATLAFDAITKTTLQPVKDLNDPSVVNDFTLYNDIDFGPTHGLRVVFIQSRSNNPAATGVFRLAKDELVAWRNEDNDGDNTISFDADGDLIVNGVKVTLHGQIVNDDIAANAGIEESKLALDYSTDSLHTAIEDKAISNLKDTNVNTPYNKQALMYDGGTSKWINRPIVLDDVSDTIVSNPNPGDILLYDGVRWSNEQNSIDALTDADIFNPADGDVLAYNSNISSWENSDKLTTVSSTLTTVSSTVTTHVADKNNPHETSLSNLKDTTISTPSNGDALTFDGSKWVNTPSTSSSLSGLSDTDITTPTSGDVLVYNNVTTKWENSDELSTVSTTVSSHVGNTSNPHSTSVSNLTDTTLSGLNYGDRLTYDSNTSKWFNQPNTLGALIDTSISSEQTGDALVYDGVQWVNQENSVNNLTNVTVSSVTNGDVLVYDSNDSEWKNSDALSTLDSTVSSHVGNTSNPHSTNVSNLTDTTITSVSDKDTLLYDSNSSKWVNVENSLDNLSNTDIDSDTLTENDVMVFNDQTSKWENSQILVNHIGNAANPHLTTVAKLTDTSITTPANKELLQYDYANSQWINSSDVWTQIEVNDIANINSANTAVTLTANDKRHQIFTATDGFNITLPSTGINVGESFVFEWANDFGASVITPFVFYSSDNTALRYAWIDNYRYVFTANTNNPTSSSDWYFRFELKRHEYKIYPDISFPVSNQSTIATNSASQGNMKPGFYDMLITGWTDIEASKTARFGIYANSVGHSYIPIRGSGNDVLGIAMGSGIQYAWSSDENSKAFSKRAICTVQYVPYTIYTRAYCVYTTNVSGSILVSLAYDINEPITDNSVTT